MELRDDRSEKVRYDRANYPIYIRRALLSSYPGYAAPIHWHDDLECIAVLSGEMDYNVNGKIVTLGANEGIVVNARQIHFGFSQKRKECDFICILLHPLLLCATPAYERDFVLPVLHNPSAAFVSLREEVLWQKKILEGVKRMYAVREEKTAPLQIQSLFLNLWTQLYENVSSEASPLIPNTDLSILKNMLGFIQQSYAERITLAEIAASGSVGQSKCCKLFAKYIGQTPNGYLIQHRLEKSTELLKSTDMTVTEIAHEVGFSAGSYYAEMFRRRSGTSPSAYRKKYKRG